MRRERERVAQEVGERSLTKQAFKDECDFNLVVKKYRATGVVDHVAQQDPVYGDVTGACELQEAIERVRSAEDHFGRLSADVRKAAANDPVQFLEMAADPAGRDILREAGVRWPGDEVSPAAGTKGADLAEDRQVEKKNDETQQEAS